MTTHRTVARHTQARPLLLAFLAIGLGGCGGTGISVERISLRDQFERLSENVLSADVPSERTRVYLRQRGMSTQWRRDPVGVIRQLDRENSTAVNRDTLYALLELSFAQAEQEGIKSRMGSMLYLSSAVYSYRYLFDTAYGQQPSAYSPYSRLACEIYNRGLSMCLGGLQSRGFKYRPNIRLPVIGGEIEVRSRTSNIAWSFSEFDHFEPAYSLEVKGLEPHCRSFGIGVPLVAVRKLQPQAPSQTEGFMPGIEQTCAATAFMRIEPPRDEGGTSLVYVADFELNDPTRIDELTVGGRTVPLETDFTTPLAYMISKAPSPASFRAMLNVDIWAHQEGLHMLQPYEKDRIPVVFVHGLMSSPMTWLPMLNTLMGDPLLRRHYQFWFFMYPTGNPVLYSASMLRNSLNAVRKECDPGGDNAHFNQMVVVAHSMGGLLAEFVIQNSGTDYWAVVSPKPLQSYDLTPEESGFISNTLFFSPLPYVSRVVFISTPHRGSDYAYTWYSRLGAWVTRVQGELNTVGRKIIAHSIRSDDQGSTARLESLDLGRIPTGLDSLRPDNPSLMVALNIPSAPRVIRHSIIGNNKAPVPGGTDGIVPYWSSHIDGVESELVIESDHSADDKPLAIEEVRRILIEHLAHATASVTAARSN